MKHINSGIRYSAGGFIFSGYKVCSEVVPDSSGVLPTGEFVFSGGVITAGQDSSDDLLLFTTYRNCWCSYAGDDVWIFTDIEVGEVAIMARVRKGSHLVIDCGVNVVEYTWDGEELRTKLYTSSEWAEK